MNNELYHHGIKGMRWGVRRTPAQLGHKPKSQMQRAKERAKKIAADSKEEARKLKQKQAAQAVIDKAKEKAAGRLDRAKNGKTKPQEEPAKKTVKDMSDAEIRERINRIRLENELKSLTPEHVSRGKRFVRSSIDDVIMPAARSAGKDLLTNWFKKKGTEMLGLDVEDSLSALKKQAEEAKLRETIAVANRNIKGDNSADAKLKKAAELAKYEAAIAEASIKKRTDKKEAAKEAQEEADRRKRAEEKEAAEKESKRLEKLAKKALDEYDDMNEKFSVDKNVKAGEDYLKKLMSQEEAYLNEIIRKRNIS